MKWNEYTWYSKWASLLFFILVLPILTFYIGTQYELTKISSVQQEQVVSAPIINANEINNKYSLVLSSQAKVLNIKEEDTIIGRIDIKEIKKFNDDPHWQDNYTFGIFSAQNNSQTKTIYDSKRDKIYFLVYDLPYSGNVNTSKALYTYNLKDKTIQKVLDIYGTGLDKLSLSPDSSYLVYNEGDHGGACQDISVLKVYDVDNSTTIGATTWNQEEYGYATFSEWIDNTDFKYAEHFESKNECDNGAPVYANEKSPTREKIFTIKPVTVTIYVPKDQESYKAKISNYLAGYNQPDVLSIVSEDDFVPQKVTVASISPFDIRRASVDAVAATVPTQGPIKTICFDVNKDGVASVLLTIDVDGWAGVSYSIDWARPIINRTLLQFPEIKKVEFATKDIHDKWKNQQCH